MLRRQSIYLGVALCFAVAGIVLFAMAKKAQEDEHQEALQRAQYAIDRRQVGIITLIEDWTDQVLQVAFPPEHIQATWPMPATLEPAGLEGLATGRFFIHTQQDTDAEGCELWHLTEGLKLEGVQWKGKCRLHNALGADFFWLDYTPSGTHETVSLPLSLQANEDGQFTFAWGEKYDDEDEPPLQPILDALALLQFAQDALKDNSDDDSDDASGAPSGTGHAQASNPSDEPDESDEPDDAPKPLKSQFYLRFQRQADALMELIQENCPIQSGQTEGCMSAARALVFLRGAQGGKDDAKALIQRMMTYAPKAGEAVQQAQEEIMDEIAAIQYPNQ